MSVVIKAEGLGKSYSIRHQQAGAYRTLRDRLSQGFREVASGKDEETFWALRDIGFEIRQGEKVGIVGRNGVGKSTLLKILSRITPPTRGRVQLTGRVASLLEVGTGFHPELSGRENIYLNGAVLGMRRRDVHKRFDQIVEFAEVERFLDTPVKRYSSGMYTRLAFAVAAHLESDILLLDEVLAVGDALFQKKCLNRIDDMKSAGRTVLLVSHNMASIQSVCERAILLENGVVAMDAPVEQTVERYLKGFSQTTEQDLAVGHLPRGEDLGQQVRIVECALVNGSGEVADKLLFGETFGIRLKIRGRNYLQQSTLLVGIDSVRSTERITTLTADYDELHIDHDRDEFEVIVTVDDFKLRPGLYSILVSVRRGRMGLDQVPMARAFEVLPLTTSGAELESSVWGLLHVDGTWCVGDMCGKQ